MYDPSWVAALCMEYVYVAVYVPPYGNIEDVDESIVPRASTRTNTFAVPEPLDVCDAARVR